MSNRLGPVATAGIITAGTLGIWFAPLASAAPLEDEPGWSCVDDGNRICGPGNTNGVPAGCYDDGGVLVASWPCYVVIDPTTGDSDVFTPDDRRIPVYVSGDDRDDEKTHSEDAGHKGHEHHSSSKKV